ncbi:hypothetical protein GOBAR_DD29141 [Gossypium barbadense]|nr:hypothetical protein GOBAR_DD29141 [Gossypium barbadense]TYI38840.1 hypothetical protein ES332_A02G056600v1 [Gossypium tomentosum]
MRQPDFLTLTCAHFPHIASNSEPPASSAIFLRGLVEVESRKQFVMDSNNGSSATVSVTETFKFNGKWAALVLPLLLMVSAAVYKCMRSRTNVQAEVELELELG